MNYKHFINLKCEFMPCHKLEDWHSCLFCYCPLFLLDCPGNYATLPGGMKDCSACVLPHTEKGWDIIQEAIMKQLYRQTAPNPQDPGIIIETSLSAPKKPSPSS